MLETGSDSDGRDRQDGHRRTRGEVLAEISRAVVKLYRLYYGRGATKARSFFVHDDLLLVEMHDIFLTVEHTLVEKGQEDTVRATRQTFQAAMRDEFTALVEEITGRKVRNYETVIGTYPPTALEIFWLEPGDDLGSRLDREQAENAGTSGRPTPGIDGSG